ncbi:MAG: hypothetical protein J6Y03_01925 [Alphaproteobacteria bacterium]|nr:hypothetical protein [Alphaproteobacteria bacterium]
MQKLFDYCKKREAEIYKQIATMNLPITVKAAMYTCKTREMDRLIKQSSFPLTTKTPVIKMRTKREHYNDDAKGTHYCIS